MIVAARGQVILRNDVLQHLGVRPGGKIELNKLPDGRVVLQAARPTGTIEDFLGLLAGKIRKIATLDEINGLARQPQRVKRQRRAVRARSATPRV